MWCSQIQSEGFSTKPIYTNITYRALYKVAWVKPKSLWCIRGQTRRAKGPFWPLKLHEFVIKIQFPVPNTFLRNCSLPRHRPGCVWTWQMSRRTEPPLVLPWHWNICRFQSRLETSASESCFICHHMHLSHACAAQHAGLSVTVDLGSPSTSFQCLKSQKGREAVELCYIEGTLLLSSRSCDKSNLSSLWAHAIPTFSSWKTWR